MTVGALADLETLVSGRVVYDAPLARYTTYRIGGPASAVVEPRTVEELVRLLAVLRQRGVPWRALGLGSNVLVGDRGFAGVVVRLGKWLADITHSAPDDPHWRVGAGLPTPLLARRTADAGWGGVHRLIGVPGTVGGGVYMNAGAHGQEFRAVVEDVELIAATGAVETRPGETVPWAYRTSGLGDVIVTGARLRLVAADPRRLRVEIAEHFRWRKAGTPFSEPCCGSVFRNPGAAPAGGALRTAGQLIDAAGLKGFRIGGAEVSRTHGNYIVNTGEATAADVLRVIEAVRERVQRMFGVELPLEVELLGEW